MSGQSLEYSHGQKSLQGSLFKSEPEVMLEVKLELMTGVSSRKQVVGAVTGTSSGNQARGQELDVRDLVSNRPSN